MLYLSAIREKWSVYKNRKKSNMAATRRKSSCSLYLLIAKAYAIFRTSRNFLLSIRGRSQSFKSSAVITNNISFAKIEFFSFLKKRILISTISLLIQNGYRNAQLFSNLTNSVALQIKNTNTKQK